LGEHPRVAAILAIIEELPNSAISRPC
jgi:hypothetical protein